MIQPGQGEPISTKLASSSNAKLFERLSLFFFRCSNFSDVHEGIRKTRPGEKVSGHFFWVRVSVNTEVFNQRGRWGAKTSAQFSNVLRREGPKCKEPRHKQLSTLSTRQDGFYWHLLVCPILSSVDPSITHFFSPSLMVAWQFLYVVQPPFHHITKHLGLLLLQVHLPEEGGGGMWMSEPLLSAEGREEGLIFFIGLRRRTQTDASW